MAYSVNVDFGATGESREPKFYFLIGASYKFILKGAFVLYIFLVLTQFYHTAVSQSLFEILLPTAQEAYIAYLVVPIILCHMSLTYCDIFHGRGTLTCRRHFHVFDSFNNLVQI